jgi:hypothetical protein
MLRSFILLVAILSFALPATQAEAQTLVPPGNRFVEQPKVPAGSRSRSRGTTFEAKYAGIRNLLAKDRKLMRKIKKAAQIFDIDPIHIIGALVGEHTYNVDAKDRLQSYYVKAASYLGASLSFEANGVDVADFVSRPAFVRCATEHSSYALWSCREDVWDTVYRGKRVDGESWPNDRFGRVFFQPLYAGQTFGLGQLNPLTALKVNDIVRARLPRERKLSPKRAPRIYATIMDPDSTLNYMAAVIRHSIDSYRAAGFDISRNPGVVATLYNLGNVTKRAQAAKRRGGMPRENYYGWLVNDQEADLRSLL